VLGHREAASLSAALFEHAPALLAIGIDHGFGLRGSAAAAPPRLCTARQVHGTRLLEAPGAALVEADALFTRIRGVAVGVYTADCVPLMIVAPEGCGVAAVHAGWRGSAAQIASLAARDLARRVGCATGDLTAAIGPHIGPCCYEVDEPVLVRITEPRVLRPGRPGHASLDLGLLNLLQLLRAGIRPEAISRVGGCTRCHPERYLSYRGGAHGRMLHFVRSPSTSCAVRPT
jgi:hypothetical protein